MALDPIWKQQLTLVTYGNEFLSQKLNFNQWLNHSIFNKHYLAFRDLNSQHLLAQHFQVWLEGLKHQGFTQLSLHNSSLLLDEKNPNPNVELLPYAHFIVSHVGSSHKTAWICGKELASWYTADNDYDVPSTQKIPTRIETMWRHELNSSHAKRVETDLVQPNWEDIQVYTDNELFDRPLAQGLVPPVELGQSYFGYHKQTGLPDSSSKSVDLPLLPDTYNATYAHETLIRLEALDQALEKKLKQPFNDLGEAMTSEEILNIRHFRQKLEDLTAKFVTKVANHYKTARLTPIAVASPLDEPIESNPQNRFFQNETGNSSQKNAAPSPPKAGKTGVLTLIIIAAIICICAYYFGL